MFCVVECPRIERSFVISDMSMRCLMVRCIPVSRLEVCSYTHSLGLLFIMFACTSTHTSVLFVNPNCASKTLTYVHSIISAFLITHLLLRGSRIAYFRFCELTTIDSDFSPLHIPCINIRYVGFLSSHAETLLTLIAFRFLCSASV